MGIGKKHIYWLQMNANIEKTIKYCLTCLDFHATQNKDKTASYRILERL